ncbi:hypothetical protein I352_05120 [Cryptococcus deuterogattii MMRL2647]|nr:hypothetical protein I352_05120 [Cryptococcus deuterogattii MMRL2647]
MLLEKKKELASVRAALALEKATWGNQKRQRCPGVQLFDLLYQEEHAEELAIRKVKEEEARRKCRQTAHVGHSRAETNTTHAVGTGVASLHLNSIRRSVKDV